MHSSAQDKRGFTLVELMVVISIISILSVIGIVLYSNAQKSARDTKRKADINAIVTAMELHLGECASSKYCNLATSYFNSSTIPQDPKEGQTICGKHTNGTSTACQYCFLNDADLDYKYRGQNEAHNGCTRAPNGSGGTYGYNNAQAGSPGGGANYVSYYILCANLETPSGPPTTDYPGGTMYYCKFSP